MSPARRPRAAEIIGRATRVGADEALKSLVHQFSDPHAFLRELIQNSLDAASTRIDVELSHDEGQGLATIAVIDNGEGMNEQVIDEHLLTLFSSTKEDDLTKIGKFGIGFVSIFAIAPELVVLETGQAGQSWRIIFHADARYEKLRLPDPVEGTTIRLFKRADAEAFSELRQRSYETVRYWCKFAEAEIAVDGEPVRQPFALGLPLSVSYREPGTELELGLPALRPEAEAALTRGVELGEDWADIRVGFYNRGLTLVEGERSPGGEADLAGLSFRVKSRYLEHTLTRDNVLQDEDYAKVIALLRRQLTERLRPALIAHLEALARHLSGCGGPDPGPPSYGACLLYTTLPAMQLERGAERAAIFPTTDGEPLSLRQLRRRSEWTVVPPVVAPPEGVLIAACPNPLTAALARDGTPVVCAQPQLAWLLRRLGVEPVDVNAGLVTAVEVELDGGARALIEQVQQLIEPLDLRVRRVTLGDLAYPGSSLSRTLCLRQRKAFGVSPKGERATMLGGARELVLNVSHPLVARGRQLALHDLPLAAHLVAQGINAVEGGLAEEADALARQALALDASRLAGGGGD